MTDSFPILAGNIQQDVERPTDADGMNLAGVSVALSEIGERLTRLETALIPVGQFEMLPGTFSIVPFEWLELETQGGTTLGLQYTDSNLDIFDGIVCASLSVSIVNLRIGDANFRTSGPADQSSCSLSESQVKIVQIVSILPLIGLSAIVFEFVMGRCFKFSTRFFLFIRYSQNFRLVAHRATNSRKLYLKSKINLTS